MLDGISRAILIFIGNYYVIERLRGVIMIHDIFESKDKYGQMVIEITPNVSFYWGRAKKVTGLDLYHKDNLGLRQMIIDIFRDERSIDFYSFLRNEGDDNMIFRLSEVKEEFPKLYNNELDLNGGIIPIDD